MAYGYINPDKIPPCSLPFHTTSHFFCFRCAFRAALAAASAAAAVFAADGAP